MALIRLLLVVAVVGVAALLAAACGDDGGGGGTAFEGLDVYDFDGEPTVLAHEDRPLVINFFAESCAPCVDEMPAFDAVYRSMIDTVDFVGVSEDPSSAAGRRIVAATGITYPAVWDADATAIAEFEAFGMPTTVFVTADGTIVDVHTGALSESALRTRITDLLTP